VPDDGSTATAGGAWHVP